MPQAIKPSRDKKERRSAFRFFVVGAVVLIASALGWRIAIYQSNVDLGLSLLKQASSSERSVESRISGFDHSPWIVTQSIELKSELSVRSELLLITAADENDDARSLAALGQFYLTQRNFEKANDVFERAARKDKDSSQIRSDWGASYLELGKRTRESGGRAKSVQLLDQALRHLDEAIQFSPKLAEARFNRALCLEALCFPEQAKAAWTEYLELDSTSQWADEARQKIARFGSEAPELKADKLRSDFLAAAAVDDRESAWRLLSNNRELITQKYIPQSLAMSITEADEIERIPLLNALDLAGDLESTNINDNFAMEIARFYRSRKNVDIVKLGEAQAAVKSGYKLCLELRYADALAEFIRARDLFQKFGDIWESNLSSYFVGYCQVNIGDGATSAETIRKVAEFANSRQFKWLEMTALYWYAGAKRLERRQAESGLLYKRALAIAEEIGDGYAIQRNLIELANNCEFIGQNWEAVEFVQRSIEVSFSRPGSLRQQHRNLMSVSRSYSRAALSSAAKASAVESITLADRLGDEMFKANSRSGAADTYLKAGDRERARTFIDDGLAIAQSIADEKTRNKLTAVGFIKSASIAEQTGDLAEATRLFRSADEILEVERTVFDQYVAKKGLLYGLKSLGQEDELDARLPVTIKLLEEYRDNIDAEKERTSFFDNGVTIYDIAVEREFDKGNIAAAFDFTELSTSRSLIDRLTANIQTANPTTHSKPLGIDAIRDRMPANVQLIKYTVLERRLMIWLISKDKFTVVTVPISATQLKDKAEEYFRMVKRGLPAESGAMRIDGRYLYDILIAPISDYLDPSTDVCLIPSKFLYYLPFASLESPNGETLLASYNIGYSPSATVFVLATANAAAKPAGKNEKLLAAGNPSFSRVDFQNMPDLPSASSEVTEIGRSYPRRRVFVDENAKKSPFVSEMPKADVIHFAGHYVAVDRDPMASYLMFARTNDEPKDSLLTNADIDKMRLPKTKLVVMAACQTGLEDYFDGEGMIGLTRTFLAAGVPVVVASQWRVDSDAASELMKKFHAHRRVDGMSTSNALRAAQLDLANDPNGRFTTPYYWAAFAVFGGHSTY